VAAAAAVVPRGPRDTPRFPRFRKASAAATTQPTTNTTRVNTAETRVNGFKSTESLVVEFRGAAARPAAPLPLLMLLRFRKESSWMSVLAALATLAACSPRCGCDEE